MGARSVHQLYPSKSFILKGPFEVSSFEHFGLERPFNTAAMIVFPLKCPLDSDIYPVWNALLDCLLEGRRKNRKIENNAKQRRMLQFTYFST